MNSCINFITKFNSGENNFKTRFGSTTYAAVKAYTGEYIITPKADTSVVLETKNKTMLDDLTVKEIPYYQVTNPADGETVYIGSEVI